MLVLLSTGLVALTAPKSVHAQGTVPGNTTFDFHAIMGNMKDFTLDRAATMVAKQLLHMMTVSVVNWINSGFKGSPAFLQNPAGFFLDAADQITGAFIANSGPLSALCSPFSIDIRLQLALSLGLPQSSLSNQRYTCTLSKIIQAQQNGPNINVSANGKTLVAGSVAALATGHGTIAGFMKGDFSQGGWPAFISLTTEPQNNPYGAYLTAQGDLQSQIDAKHASINADLSMGAGFMSWQSCQDLGTIDPNDPNSDTQFAQADALSAGNPSVSTTMNKDGTVMYQKCTTQTPGSVISGTLQKQLNVPADELELANNINAVINALVTQLTSQLLSKGLGMLSSGSGSSPAYTAQVSASLQKQQAAANQSTQQSVASTVASATANTNNYKALYDQAVSVITDAQTQLTAARDCFSGKLNDAQTTITDQQRTFGEHEIDLITTTLNSNVATTLTYLTSKQKAAADQIASLQAANSTQSYAPQTDENGNLQVVNYENDVNNQLTTNSQIAGASSSDITQAQNDLKSAQKLATSYSNQAASYQKTCDGFPDDTPAYF
jgi:hypothetical protein